MWLGKIMIPSALIPGTWEYATLHSERDLADAIKVKKLEKGRLSWITKDPVETHDSLQIRTLSNSKG